MNKLYLKQIQTNQREIETDCRKSNMEIHCVKPKYETTQTMSQQAKTSKIIYLITTISFRLVRLSMVNMGIPLLLIRRKLPYVEPYQPRHLYKGL